jgi:hypothetical protein
MPTVGNYSAIHDGNFKLSSGGDKHHDDQFKLPAGAPRYEAILAFRVLPDSGTNLFLIVELNGFNVFQGTVIAVAPSNDFRTVHEIIEVKDPAILKSGALPNTIRFKLASGSGAVTCSDVVLWYKHDV